MSYIGVQFLVTLQCFVPSTFEDSPIMNLDPFGDQSNKVWYTYTASKHLIVGEEFSLFMGK